MVKKEAHHEGSGQAVTMAARVSHRLQDLGANPLENKSLATLPVDITDVYDICTNYLRLVDKLLALPDGTDSEEVMRIIFDLETHLGIHLSYHQKRLLKQLRVLEKIVQPDKKKREQFASKVFDEINQRVRRREYGRSPNVSDE